MGAWLQNFFAWLPEGMPYYSLVGLIAFLESIPGLGLLVPGSLLTIFAGFLALHGKGEIVSVMGASALGALLGDVCTWVAGARLGPILSRRGFFQRRQEVLRRAELFMVAHGGKSVFLGRFIGPLRGFIPFVAGYARMSPAIFSLYAFGSALLWGIAYPGLGYLGGASWQRVQVLAGRFSLVLTLLVVLLVLNALFWKKAAPPLARRISHLWGRIRNAWNGWLRRPAVHSFALAHPRLWSWLADRFTLHRGSGLYLTTGLAVSALFAAAFIGFAGELPWLDRLDRALYVHMASLRHPTLDAVLVAIAALGDAPVLLVFTLFAFSWLVLLNRDFSALILVAGMAGGELLVFVVQLLFLRPGPEPLVPQPPAFFTAFPSGHAFSAALLVGLCVYFILGSYTQWQARLRLIMAGSFLVLLVGMSRALLGLQWLSGVLAGFALSAVWLTFLVTAGEMRRRYAGEFPWRVGWQPLHLRPTVRTFLILAFGLAAAAAVVFLVLRRLQGL